MIGATNDRYHLPDKGLVGRHAIFDPAMLDSPVMDQAFRAQQTPDGREEPWKVDIKRRGALSTVPYPYNPHDAVGWKDGLTPVKDNGEHLRQLVSREERHAGHEGVSPLRHRGSA